MTIYSLSSISTLKKVNTLFVMLLISLFLFGCDNTGKSSKNSISGQQKTQKYTKETILSGEVSNKKKALSSGEISVTDSKGKVVATSQLQKDNSYSVKVPAGTELPILISVYPKGKKTDKDKLMAAVIYASITKYDINELTTTIAKKAKQLGGYTKKNMVLATDGTVNVPDANKTTSGFRGDPTKQYGGWH